MLRLGIPTASEFAKIITAKKGALSSQAASYMHFLLASWMVGKPLETYESGYMQRGKEFEPDARREFTFQTGLEVESIGFITNDLGTFGASPDGLVGKDAVLEIKVPAPWTHVGYLLAGGIDGDYHVQIQGELYVSERDRAYVQSYCPGLPSRIIEVGRNEEFIANLAEKLDAFVGTMLEARDKIVRLYGDFPIIKPAPVAEDCGALGISDDDVKAIWAARQAALYPERANTTANTPVSTQAATEGQGSLL